MLDSIDPKLSHRPTRRCEECDEETNHYIIRFNPKNEPRVICHNCLSREEKGFFAKPGFQRASRWGVIPR
ncbi:MAG TPA: hypothetical protein VNK26_04730 [Pyrinomonadaceae bacterium]|jgi:hypothetical protein|nr:hypothetical protein [Pyrinomonadaceae bacterium]